MNDNNTIKVLIKSAWGNENIYPVCGKAKLLTHLVGTKTFSLRTIAILKQLGYTIEVVNNIPKQL